MSDPKGPLSFLGIDFSSLPAPEPEPLPRRISATYLRDAIAETFRARLSTADLPAACDAVGIRQQPGDPDQEAQLSKRDFVRSRLSLMPLAELIRVGRTICDEYTVPELERIVRHAGASGPDGQLKNLIFAAIGPKPRIVLRDALENEVEIVEHAEHCLIYDRPFETAGLSWRQLAGWWRDLQSAPEISDLEAAKGLFARLQRSLASEPERALFRRYGARIGSGGEGLDLPALIPQVYLHYDPYTVAELGDGVVLARQRMDFLMLFEDRARVVVEVDGAQHYSVEEGGARIAKPRLYSEMMAEDRALRLRGYEVCRFGAYELAQADAREVLDGFFHRLLLQHGVKGP